MQTLKQTIQRTSALQSMSGLSDNGIQKGRSVFEHFSHYLKENDRYHVCSPCSHSCVHLDR